MDSQDMTAVDRVFATPHVLEMILSGLDMRKLLFSQRVNSTFRATIKASPELQRILWFTPSKDPDPDGRIEIMWPSCPLLQPQFVRRVRFNPLLVAMFPNFFPNSKIGRGRDHFLELPWAQDEDLRRAMVYPNASWRRMLMSEVQPASATLRFKSDCPTKTVHFGHLDLPLRMGDVYDVVHELAVVKGKGARGGFRLLVRRAKPLTDEHRMQEVEQWKDYVVALTHGRAEFIYDIDVSHYACAACRCKNVEGLQSETPDLLDFDKIECVKEGRTTTHDNGIRYLR